MKKNWSISLEHDEYTVNRQFVISDSLKAVRETEKGYYVNLVTPENFGHPQTYLVSELEKAFGEKIEMKFIDQCGCGGYVLRVWKK